MGNSGGYLLPLWNIECNDRNNNGNMTIVVRATKTITHTGNSGATSLPPIGQSFMYIETSSNKSDSDSVFCSFERIDKIQLSNFIFYYFRFSSSDPNLRAMGRFRIQILFNGIWETKSIHKCK